MPALHAHMRQPLGEVLLERGLLTQEQLNKALSLSRDWNSRLGDVVLCMGWVPPKAFYGALAAHFGLDFVDLIENPVDANLVEPSMLVRYTRDLYIPWKREDGVIWIATSDPSSAALEELQAADPAIRIAVTSKFDVIWELQRVAETPLSHTALYHLAEQSPNHSARVVVTRIKVCR